jgi:lysozyme family protein
VWLEDGFDNDKDGDIDGADLLLMTEAQANAIYKKEYWDRVSGDKIKSQLVADIIADWGVNSGAKTAAMQVQKILGIKQDGKIGAQTLGLINGKAEGQFYMQLLYARANFYKAIVKSNPEQRVFFKGWLNRLNRISQHHKALELVLKSWI